MVYSVCHTETSLGVYATLPISPVCSAYATSTVSDASGASQSPPSVNPYRNQNSTLPPPRRFIRAAARRGPFVTTPPTTMVGKLPLLGSGSSWPKNGGLPHHPLGYLRSLVKTEKSPLLYVSFTTYAAASGTASAKAATMPAAHTCRVRMIRDGRPWHKSPLVTPARLPSPEPRTAKQDKDANATAVAHTQSLPFRPRDLGCARRPGRPM
mmetsp:Transcript_1992/g.6381  ORF Transcript_1992/g.6381 Transcript_1992/m.6381 type:complete len:210 (-) Transcript_1992:5-634(-)